MIEGWVCPKCGFVWAIYVMGCSNCNQVKTISASSANTHYCTNPRTDGSCGCGLSK